MSKEQRIVNEIVDLLSDPSNIQSDFSEAVELMREHIHKKYIKKIMGAIEYSEEKIIANPPDEINLLKALKPFTPKDSHDKIDNFVRIFQRYNTLMELRSKFSGADSVQREISASSCNTDSSVHDDGIYDIDENCAVHRRLSEPDGNSLPGILMMMAMMGSR